MIINTAWRKKKVSSFPNRVTSGPCKPGRRLGTPIYVHKSGTLPGASHELSQEQRRPAGYGFCRSPASPGRGTPLLSPTPDPEHLRRRSGQRGPRGPPGSLRFPERRRRRRPTAPHRRERGWLLQAETRARDDAAVTSVRGHRAGRAATPAPRRRRASPARTPRGRAHRPARSLVPGSAERS